MSQIPFVYLAHPIDFVDPFGTQTSVESASYHLKAANLAVYLPSKAFKIPLGEPANGTVGAINRAALSQCDALVAFLPPPGSTSIGVPMEIEQARSENKPALIVGDPETIGRSWALPRTELVIFTDELDEGVVREFAGLIARTRRARNRPPASKAMYTQLDPGAVLPTRAYEGDAGFDMYTLVDTIIPAGEFVDVPVGCRVQFPDGVWGLVAGRSSTLRKHDLMVLPGIIDTGYRGLLFAGVRSLRDDDYTVAKGERLAQLIPLPNVAQTMHATPVDVLAPSDRGEAGFGSSGA